ncbi:unnamed protein product [Diamesa hyperborea]
MFLFSGVKRFFARNFNRLTTMEGINNIVKSSDAIPGPSYIPFLGVLNDIFTMKSAANLHETIDNYHTQYGPVVKIRIGDMNAVFISSADLMRSVFAHEGKYPKHPIPPAWIYFNQKYNVKRGILFMDDEEWLDHRKLLNNFLMRDFNWATDLIDSACDNFVENVSKSIDKCDNDYVVPDLVDELYHWSISVMLNLMLGSSYTEQQNAEFSSLVLDFSIVVKRIFECSAPLMSIPPAQADKWNLKIWTDFEQVAMKSIELSRKLIRSLSNDMECSENGLLYKMRAQNLSEEIIERLFGDLIIAAGDTTAYTAQWCLHSISQNEEIYDKLKTDIKQSPGNNELPLIRACVREVLRLYPVAPFIGRILDTDANIGGYTVPKGWMALISLYTSGRDPDNFTNPLVFAPERWLRTAESTESVFKATGSMPFAMGVRSCVGKRIANYQLNCLLTKILQQFSLESQNGIVRFKLKLIGVPAEQINIAFKKLNC